MMRALTLALLLAPCTLATDTINLEIYPSTIALKEDSTGITSVSLANQANQFSASLTFGNQSKVTKADLILDSRSTWTTVNSKACEGCGENTNIFEPSSSTIKTENTDSIFTTTGEGAQLSGDSYTDVLCYDNLHCVLNYEFLVVDAARYLNPWVQGYLGLAPSDPKSGKSFINALFDKKLISNAQVAVSMKSNVADLDGNIPVSKIAIGGYNSADRLD